MAVRVIVTPTGPKATPAAIEAWKASAQQVANEQNSEVDLKGWNSDNTIVTSHLIATPEPTSFVPGQANWRGDGTD